MAKRSSESATRLTAAQKRAKFAREFKAWWLRQQLEALNGDALSTVEELAKFLELPRPTVNAWLNGKRLPTGDNVYSLADKIGKVVWSWLGEPEPDPNLQEVISLWGKLPSDVQRKIVAMARAGTK